MKRGDPIVSDYVKGSNEMPELLWELFKKTGDVRIYILYKNFEKLYGFYKESDFNKLKI